MDSLEIITAKKLQSLSVEYQRQFEGLLPELVKRLIMNSCESIDSIRIPNGEDIWAPGFDGIVYCSEQNEYINSGNSVWEFGTSNNSLKKINEDSIETAKLYKDLYDHTFNLFNQALEKLIENDHKIYDLLVKLSEKKGN